ncbi:hypothetical protein [Halioxenophilus aromaticivorans]|uniref:Uncharacterized protein n=1 Tax=Halioxenophilus aromaticivorans TaxID=1306992 RepID=A0AAV3TZG2_9ALTE
MKDIDLCKSALGVHPPWSVEKVRVDAKGRRVDVWLGQQSNSGLLRAASKAFSQQNWISWRHLNMFQHHVFIHAHRNDDIQQKNVQWLGQPGLNLTRAMAKQVVKMLSEGTSYSAVCSLLELQLSDIWPIKRALDEGRLTLGGKKVEVKNSKAGSPTPLLHAQADDGLPTIDDQVWEKIAAGVLDVHIKPLALKLLIAKIRGQLVNIDEKEGRQVKLNEVRRYFVKHRQKLSGEIQHLKAIA